MGPKSGKDANAKPKSISKGHMTFTSAEAGYFNEMIGREERTRWNFSLDKNYLSRPRDPTLGEKTPRDIDNVEYYLPPEGTKDIGPLPVEPDRDEMRAILKEQKRVEALKLRREEVKAKMHAMRSGMLGSGVLRTTRNLAMEDAEHIEPPPRRINPTRYTLVMMSEGFKSSATPECIDRIMASRKKHK